MNYLLLVVLVWSAITTIASASTDFLLSSQHLSITRSNEEGWQHELVARHDFGRKTNAGISGTYLERFSFFEKRFGGFITQKLNDRLTVEARYYMGMNDNEILPRDQRQLSAYYALAPGFTPYIYLRDYRYSVTRVNMATIGMEIEKIPSIILIPQFMAGRATFSSPASTEGIYNYGLRAMYYQEQKFTAYVFGYMGREASQGIVGRTANFLVDTKTAGLGGSYYWTENFRTEFVVDHTDYDQLKRQFIMSTLNLYWTVN